MHVVIHFTGKRSGQTCDYMLIHGLWPMFWISGQGLEMTMFGKLLTIKFGEEIYGRVLHWAKKEWVPCDAHQSVTSQRKISIIK